MLSRQQLMHVWCECLLVDFRVISGALIYLHAASIYRRDGHGAAAPANCVI